MENVFRKVSFQSDISKNKNNADQFKTSLKVIVL